MPRVSIGFPVYNGEPSMRRALDCLLAQTFTDYELIISDNASTDATTEIARDYAAREPRIRYVRQTHNLGAFGNFDAVLGEAKGDLFSWAAADDFHDPDHFADLVAQLDTHPEAVVAMSGTRRLRPSGDVLDVIDYRAADPNVISPERLAWVLAAGAPYHLFIYGLWRREVLRSAFATLPMVKGGDRLLIWRVALTQRFRYSGRVTYSRTFSPAPAHLRYRETDASLAKLYASNLAYLGTAAAAVRYIGLAPGLSWRMRALMPAMLLRHLWFNLRNIARALNSGSAGRPWRPFASDTRSTP